MREQSNRMYYSLQRRKRFFYALFSLLLSIGLLSTGIFDLIFLLALERPEITTHNALSTIMILHVVAFYLSLLGFIHSSEARTHSQVWLSLSGGGLSLASLLIRVVQELALSGYYPVDYAVT